MRGFCVLGVGFAGGPDFVKEEAAGGVGRAVKIIGEAAVFFARGADHGPEFGFKQGFLAFAGTEKDDESDGVFGEPGGAGFA